MKIATLALALLAFTTTSALPGAFAATNTDSTQHALAQIRTNADAVQHNAAIYQWKRVNLEVDRIVTAAKSLASVNDTSDAASLNQAILTLRSARVSHDVDASISAAKTISDLSVKLAK